MTHKSVSLEMAELKQSLSEMKLCLEEKLSEGVWNNVAERNAETEEAI